MSCQLAVIPARLADNKTKLASVGGGLSCPCINPSLLLLCKRSMSHKLTDLLSKINGIEQPPDFSHF